MKPKRAQIKNENGSRITVEVWKRETRVIHQTTRLGIVPVTMPPQKLRALAKWILREVPE